LSVVFPGDDDREVLTARVGDHAAVLAFNRPGSRNAVNSAVAGQVHQFVLEVEGDHQLRVGILTGVGPAFCAGADLKERAAQGKPLRFNRAGGFAGFVEQPRSKPWIIALNGPAWGGGTELALAADIVIGCPASSLGLAEVKRGLVALSGGAIRLPRAIPRAVALEALITGEPITAQRAYDLGLINHLVPQTEVLTEALRVAEVIAANSPFAVRETLQLAKQSLDYAEPDMWRQNQTVRERLIEHPDALEGPMAFTARRPPVWQ
jgi:enoyl-CoA hydratase